MDAYNSTNGTSLPGTSNLSDNQLQTIINLDCRSKNISDVSGIEKMTSLTSLDLRNNKLESIDLSKNVSLRFLYLNNNNLQIMIGSGYGIVTYTKNRKANS